MFNIRKFNKNDILEISKWCNFYSLPQNTLDIMPENTSYILEINNNPAIIACLYLTECKKLAFIENVIGNPKFKGPLRSEGLTILCKYLENLSKELNYEVLIILAEKEKLKDKYENMGYIKTLNNLTLFTKVLNRKDI